LHAAIHTLNPHRISRYASNHISTDWPYRNDSLLHFLV
jgi:hypothetical protein